jgi:glycosyltransferase involved in cell wall biosynthesis
VTIGYGEVPAGVESHFVVPILPLWQRYLGYLMRISQTRFQYFFGRFLDRIPKSVFENVDLVVVNEIEYLHWYEFRNGLLKNKPTYLDLHEDHVNHADRGPLERFAFRQYWRWQLEQCVLFVAQRRGRIAITSVEKVIADSYSLLFGEPVALIYNAPDRNSLEPTRVDPTSIKLVHHGMGTKGRGIESTIRALSLLDSKYTLDLILFTTALYRLKIQALATLLGVKDRVRILPGVPLASLPQTLNKYDISVILLSAVTPGHFNSLPNKLFESIHAKLAVVTGPNPSMKRIVEQSLIGVALKSWNSVELANSIKNLSIEEINTFKLNTLVASPKLSSESSREVFRSAIKSAKTSSSEGF